MEKSINGSRISFSIDEEEKMVMDFYADEFVWSFTDSEVLTITEDMDLFEPIKQIMNQEYIFSNKNTLKDYKDKNKLVWYSDCCYDPNDKWSINSISYLTIEKVDDKFNIYCTKPLDDMVNRPRKVHSIAFSPSGNGKYSLNKETGSTLQDDIIINLYQKLLERHKEKKKKRD